MAIEWGTIIISAIVSLMSAGGLGWIITAREDKKAKALENKEKELKIEEERKDEVIKDWKELAEERKRAYEEEKEKTRELENKINTKDDIINDLKNKLDQKNTYCAVAELMRCESISCEHRRPPFGTREVKVQDNFVVEN